jgi:hypothetical protein
MARVKMHTVFELAFFCELITNASVAEPRECNKWKDEWCIYRQKVHPGAHQAEMLCNSRGRDFRRFWALAAAEDARYGPDGVISGSL